MWAYGDAVGAGARKAPIGIITARFRCRFKGGVAGFISFDDQYERGRLIARRCTGGQRYRPESGNTCWVQ